MSKVAALKARIAETQDEDFGDVAVAEPQVDDLATKTGLTTASHFQIDIFQHLVEQINNYVNGTATSSLAVEAVAGSGKSTTIVAASKLIPINLKAIFLAFNKSIADELNERLPGHVRARTLNSLGFSLLVRYLGSLGIKNIDVRSNRTSALIRKELSFKQKDNYGADVAFLVNQCKSMGVVPVNCTDGQGVNGMEATDDVLNQICMHHGRMVDVVDRPTVYSLTRRILDLSWSDARIYEDNMIDFDDQKWLTVCKRPNGRTLARPQYDVVIIDEVQDVNSVDIELIRMVLKENGIVIGVGDSKQAIYGFRGADTKAFETFTQSFNAITLPLSITYRCGSKIVEHAQSLVPTIQAAPQAKEGEVVHLKTYDASTFKAGDLVLCRNNAPLIEFAYKLIRARVPVFVKGRNIGEGLIRLINDCVAEKKFVPNPHKPGKKMPTWTVEGKTVPELQDAILAWKHQQIDLIRQEDPDNEAAVQKVEDQYDCIRLFLDANTDGKVSSVIEDIEGLFSDADETDAVICATIHKAKGLEADRVWMYRPDCLYPFWIEADTWQHEQEGNLDYVARTRAKSLYGYLAKDGWTNGEK